MTLTFIGASYAADKVTLICSDGKERMIIRF
jgi:hypothetical protein